MPYLVTIERTTFVSSTFCQLNVIAKDYSQIDVNFRTYYGFFYRKRTIQSDPFQTATNEVLFFAWP